MSRTVVSASQLGAVLRRDDKARRRGIHVGLRRAAHRGRSLLVQKTRESGKIHMGHFRAAWRVVQEAGKRTLDRRQGQNYVVLNDAPHAGIIEMGARPHKVNRAGVEAIREWVRRKLLGWSQADADSNALTDEITWGIVRKIEREGQKGTFIVLNSLPELRRIASIEVNRAIKERVK